MKPIEPSSATPARGSLIIEVAAWIGTALLLASYLGLSLGWLEVTIPFLACQFIGQIAIAAVSWRKAAWQPAVVNGVFALVSLAGIVRLMVAG